MNNRSATGRLPKKKKKTKKPKEVAPMRCWATAKLRLAEKEIWGKK